MVKPLSRRGMLAGLGAVAGAGFAGIGRGGAAFADLPVPVPVAEVDGAVTMALHVSAKERHRTIDAVFQACGGQRKLESFVKQNDANYQWFMEKLWVKGLPRVSQADVQLGGEGVETLLSRLDAGEHAQVISASPIDRDAVDA